MGSDWISTKTGEASNWRRVPKTAVRRLASGTPDGKLGSREVYFLRLGDDL